MLNLFRQSWLVVKHVITLLLEHILQWLSPLANSYFVNDGWTKAYGDGLLAEEHYPAHGALIHLFPPKPRYTSAVNLNLQGFVHNFSEDPGKGETLSNH